jgi:hypothetical protein
VPPARTLAFPILEPARELVSGPAAEERALLAALAAEDVDCVFVDWQDPAAWHACDAVSPKYLWGYHLFRAELATFLDRLAEVHAINHHALLRWNADKRYLVDLEARGVAVAELAFFEPGSAVDVAAVAAERGWDHVVLKPAVSAGSHQLTHGAVSEELQRAAEEILRDSPLIVQPFFDEILNDGELTLLFFGGQLGHAVLRRAAAGDYRAHPMFGGSIAPVHPPESIVRQCRHTLDLLDHLPTYARFDGFVRRTELALTELELFDPSFFLSAAPPSSLALAARAFAQAIGPAQSKR